MIKIRSDADTTGFKETKKELHDVETASDKAGNAVAALGRKIDGLDGKTVKVNVDVDAKNFEIPSLAGGDSVTVKAKVEPDRESAASFMSKLSSTAMSAGAPALKLLGNHTGITVGAAAGAAAAPVLASAIGSALAGGVGAGVIGAGIAVAIAQDKSLQAVGKDVGKTFMENIGREAKVFNGPIRESLEVLEVAGGRIARSWGTAFDALDDQVVPFVRDIVAGTERISDSFVNVAKDGAVLDGLGSTWRLLADGVGDFVEIVADGGPEASANLQLVAGATGDLLRQTGMTLNMLNDLASNPWVTGGLIPKLREHYVDAADATGTFAQRTKGAAEASEDAANAARGQTSALEGLSKELKAQADPVFAIVKAQDDLSKAQKETAEATKKHGKNSAEAEAALQKQALAALALESNIGKLGDEFNGKMTPAMRNTLRAAGLTDGAIRRLERQFAQAKATGDRFSKTYAAKMRIDGAGTTISALNRAAGIAASLDGYTINIGMKITGVTNVSKAAAAIRKQYQAHGGIGGAASGGMRNGLTLVGEEGPELAEIAPGGRVWSNPDTRRMLSDSGGGAGGGPLVVQLVIDGRVLAEQLVEPTRNMVARQAGGNAQQFFGQGR